AAADVVDGRRLLGQVAATFVGNRIDLLALLLAGGDIAQILEHLQRRVDRAGARAVAPAHALFEGADDVVAVARLVLEQVEDDVLQVAPTEETLLAEVAESASPAASPVAEGPVAAVGVGPAAGSEKAEAEVWPAVVIVWSKHECVLL